MDSRAVIALDGWAGRIDVPVTVLGATRTRYRVRLEEEARLPGRRHRAAGAVVLVPKHAVRWPGPPP
jgi:hypothetical protein